MVNVFSIDYSLNQLNRKLRPLIHLAFNADRAAKGFNLVAGNEQANALSFRVVMEGLVHTKYAVTITFHIYTHAIVLKVQVNMATVSCCAAFDERRACRITIFQGV